MRGDPIEFFGTRSGWRELEAGDEAPMHATWFEKVRALAFQGLPAGGVQPHALPLLPVEPHSGRLHLTTLAADYRGQKSAAEIGISQSGRFVYVSNRGEDTLVAYAMNPQIGLLTEVQRIASQGKTPWSFALDPSGRWMLVANEASSSVRGFGIDPATDRLTASAETLAVPKPVSVTLLCNPAVSCASN